jgi:hypothetical protein
MDLDAAIQMLRALNTPVPKPMRLPTPDEVDAVERQLGASFHPDFRRYLLRASDVVFGAMEPVTVAAPGFRTFLPGVCQTAWEGYGVPKDLVPLCEDNADFYCVNGKGEVVFWSHSGLTGEKWPNIAAWIEQVWIGESA